MRFSALWAVALAGLSAVLTATAQQEDFQFTDDPAIVLKPRAPPGHAKEHISTLHPRSAGKHFWTPNGDDIDPEMATMFAEANITYQHPAVILPHSDLIRFTFCRNDGIEIGFHSLKAYDYVKSHWTVDALADEKFLLITESLHCNDADVGLHVYWLVSKLDFNDRQQTVIATAVEVPLAQAYDDVQIAWGSTNPHNDRLGGGGVDFEGEAHGELRSSLRRRGPPPGAVKRAEPVALFQPWYANIPQANSTKVQYSTAMITPQYYFTPLPGTTLTPADRFTVITLAPNAGSNTTGYLVYGYGGQSATQIQPNAYYSITNPARPLAPGYNLYNVAQGSCPVPLISYIFREPATSPSVQPPSGRDGFDVSAWAKAAGLGQPIGTNMISVVNGAYPASCDIKISSSASSSASSSSSAKSTSAISSSSSSVSSSSVKPSSSSSSAMRSSSSSAAPRSSSSMVSPSAGPVSSSYSSKASPSAKPSSSSSSATSSSSSSTKSSLPPPVSDHISSSSSKFSSALSSSPSSSQISSSSSSSSSQLSLSGSSSSSSKSSSSSALPSSWSAGSSSSSSSKSSSAGSSSSSSKTSSSFSALSASSSSVSSSLSSRLSSSSSSSQMSSSSSASSSSVKASASAVPISGSCSNPPESFKGVPAAACGLGFDDAKDAKAGFFNLETPGDGPLLLGGSSGSKRSILSSIGDFFTKDIPAAGEAIGSAIVSGANSAAKLAEDAFNAAKDKFNDLVDVVVETLSTPVNAPFSQSVPVEYYPGTLVDSPWGKKDSVLIFSTTKKKDAGGDQEGFSGELNVYCQKCGFSGTTVIYGRVAFTIIPGDLTALEIGIRGDLRTTINVGIEATLQYNKIYKKNLVSKPVPRAGVVVSNMFQLGFVLNADAVVNFKSKITGNVLVGGSMEISNFDAKVDLLRGTGSQSGWTPRFKFDPSKDFQAAGKITASVAVSMPVEFVLGISIFPIDFRKVIGVRNTPMLTGKTELSVGTANSNQGGSTCPNGVSYSLDFIESVDFDLGGKIRNLYEYKKDAIIAGCYKIPGLPDPVTSSSSMITSSTTLSSSRASPPTSASKISNYSQPPPSSSSISSRRVSMSSSSSSSSVRVSSGSSSASSTSSSSSAAPPVKTYAIAPNSPLQSGDYEQARVPGVYLGPDFRWSEQPTATDEASCSTACRGKDECNATWFSQGRCVALYYDEIKDMMVYPDAASASFFPVTCQQLSVLRPEFDSVCQRFIQNYVFDIDPKSPAQYGPVEWARLQDVYIPDRLYTRGRKLDGPTDELSCGLACAAAEGCLSALWAPNNDNLCNGYFVPGPDQFDVVRVKGTSSFAIMTCDALVIAKPELANDCKRFFPPRPVIDYPVADNSPLIEKEQLEYSVYEGFISFSEASPINFLMGSVKYAGMTDITLEECTRLCTNKDGCVGVNWQQVVNDGVPVNYCLGHTSATRAFPGASATFMSIKTCAENEDVYRDYTGSCARYFPQSITASSFSTYLGSPGDVSNSATLWSYFEDGTYSILYYTVGPTTDNINQCVNACQSKRAFSCAGVTWNSDRRCTFLSRDDANPTVKPSFYPYRPDIQAPVFTTSIFFYPCTDVVASLNDYGRLSCQNYVPTNPQLYGLAIDSPVSGGLQERAYFADYVVTNVFPEMPERRTLYQCTNMACCVSAAEKYGYTTATLGFDGNAKTATKRLCVLGRRSATMSQLTLRPAVNPGAVFPLDTVVLMSCAEVLASSAYVVESNGKTGTCKRYYAPPFAVPDRRDRHTLISNRQTNADAAAEINAVLAVSNLEEPAVVAALQESIKAAAAISPGTVIIRDLSGSYQLAPQANGNLLLTRDSSVNFRFAANQQGIVIGDGSSSVFIYDVREMAAFGVARFRYKSAYNIARSSRFVTLSPINYDKNPATPGVYVAVDFNGGAFIPVVCKVGGETKMFLVKELAAGITALQSQELQVVVTGGPATECAVASLMTSGQAGI